MARILFLCHRIPYPPNKGDKIRAFPFLRHLTHKHEVHLGCLIDDPDDVQYVETLRSYCADVAAFRPTHLGTVTRLAAALLQNRPLSPQFFWSIDLSRWVESKLPGGIDLIFVFSSAMAQYLERAPNPLPPVLIDYVDVDSEKWRQYAGTRRWPLSSIYAREGRRLLEFDRAVGRNAAAAIFVSEPEAALFRSLAPELADKVIAIPNGVDAEFFSPQATGPIEIDGNETGPVLVMTGAMDYWPNVDGATWFANDVFRNIRQVCPASRLLLVGANPSAPVQQLSARPGITVTGRVADVRPYLRRADIVIAPLRIARGVQNKVLEGMSMAKPVVTTPEGASGINAEPGVDLIVADGAASCTDAILNLLNSPRLEQIGAAARRRVLAHHSWTTACAGLDRALESALNRKVET